MNYSIGKKLIEGVQWLIDTWKKKQRTIEQFADEQMFLSAAPTHIAATTTLHLLFDILAHRECADDLKNQIKEVKAEDGKLMNQTLAKLKKLDCFMKESQRLNLLGYRCHRQTLFFQGRS